MRQNESLFLFHHSRASNYLSYIYFYLFIRQTISFLIITSARCNRDESAYKELAKGFVTGDREKYGEK